MTLKEYFEKLPRGAKVKMAKELKITKTWLSLVLNNKFNPSPQLAMAIQEYTREAVKAKDLRPDIWGKK